MPTYAQVKLGSVFLTSTGLSSGTGCKVRVEGSEQFASDYVSTSITALDGTVYRQTVDYDKRGRRFAVVCDYLSETVCSSIVTVLNNALGNNTTVSIEVTDYVSFNVTADPVFQNGRLFAFESRSGGILRNVRFEFISVS